MLLAVVPRNLRVGCRVRNNSFQPEILGMLGEIISLGPLFFGQVREVALKLHKRLLLDLLFKGKEQHSLQSMRLGVKIMGVDGCHRLRSARVISLLDLQFNRVTADFFVFAGGE